VAGPLENITVVELAGYLSGPYAGMLLADLGADVIKVENLRGGDPFRGWEEEGYGSTFCAVNRNKRSLALDLKAEEGRAILLQLAGRADVMIENFRPEVAERLGIGYETLHERNPRLVYCSISGFGTDGPYRDWPGYDTVGQAMGGLASLLFEKDAPRPVGVSLSDHVTGLFACYGILAGLFARERTGQGQRVTTSLLGATASFVQEAASRYFATGVVPDRETRVRSAQVYAFVAGDGRSFVIHLSSPSKFWEGLTAAIGQPELRVDPRFCDRAARIRNYDLLRSLLASRFAEGTSESWLERLRERGVPCGPIRSIDEVFADPCIRELGLVVDLDHPRQGPVRCSGNPVALGANPVSYRLPPPLLGEQTDEVLIELGLDAATVAQLRTRSIVGGAT
jgi:crotonobetainyl-CoA:carnitine CoA-transferase CaiB-like acyl-CoA transferase